MTDDITIRKGKIADKEQILKLWNEMMDYHRKITKIDFEMVREAPELFMKYYTTHVRSRNKLAVVAEVKRKIVGYLLGSIQKRPPVMKTTHHAFISDIAVTGKYRRKGIGSKIIDEFEKWAKEKRVKYIVLNVARKNDIGISFWNKTGFETMMYLKRKLL